ncbi:hypothetical protein SISNIDRAFT_482659 [Sistotremastrum niveocremeum HHB9708]|uniref:Uncharacterized protein n=1 Tax=Sistotremastrum niveocremeum HHB9708 TaxID=1314777 RepID=A0A164YG27_9AGAM|nr:hypothetical protein SISNIDRAFT_482659 [Sistotremastrum niveocremeum HHB9708]
MQLKARRSNSAGCWPISYKIIHLYIRTMSTSNGDSNQAPIFANGAEAQNHPTVTPAKADSIWIEMLMSLSEKCVATAEPGLTAHVLGFFEQFEASHQAQTLEVDNLRRNVAAAARTVVSKTGVPPDTRSHLEKFLDQHATSLLSAVTDHAGKSLFQEIVETLCCLSLHCNGSARALNLLKKRLLPSILNLPEVSRISIFPVVSNALKESWMSKSSDVNEVNQIRSALLSIVFACTDLCQWKIARQCIKTLLSDCNVPDDSSILQFRHVLQELLCRVQEVDERGDSYMLTFTAQILLPTMEMSHAAGCTLEHEALAPTWVRTLKFLAPIYIRSFPVLSEHSSPVLSAHSFTSCRDCNRSKLLKARALEHITPKQFDDIKHWLSKGYRLKPLFTIISDPCVRETLLGSYFPRLIAMMRWMDTAEHNHLQESGGADNDSSHAKGSSMGKQTSKRQSPTADEAPHNKRSRTDHSRSRPVLPDHNVRTAHRHTDIALLGAFPNAISENVSIDHPPSLMAAIYAMTSQERSIPVPARTLPSLSQANQASLLGSPIRLANQEALAQTNDFTAADYLDSTEVLHRRPSGSLRREARRLEDPAASQFSLTEQSVATQELTGNPSTEKKVENFSEMAKPKASRLPMATNRKTSAPTPSTNANGLDMTVTSPTAAQLKSPSSSRPKATRPHSRAQSPPWKPY